MHSMNPAGPEPVPSRAATADRDRRVLEARTLAVVYQAKEVAAVIGATVSAMRRLFERRVRSGRVVRVEPVRRGLALGCSGRDTPCRLAVLLLPELQRAVDGAARRNMHHCKWSFINPLGRKYVHGL